MGSRVYTVEGNSGDACKIKSYALDYGCIKGYGLDELELNTFLTMKGVLTLWQANKIDRINREIEKTREKITEYQNKLKGLEAQKTEAENFADRPACALYAAFPAGAYRHAVKTAAIPGMTPAPASYGADNDEQEENEDEE